MNFGSAGINHKFLLHLFEHELEICNLVNTNEGKHVYTKIKEYITKSRECN